MNWPLLVRLFLWPYSAVYGAAVRLHAWLYRQGVYPVKRLSVPVISVGNLTVGGTGKTPMVLWLAERFLSEKKHVGILSRGYRGSDGTSDEIEMLRSRLGKRAVFGVGPDRYQEGLALQKEHPIDVFLLDDGFQHQELARDVDIVLVDSTADHSRQWLLPAGDLREPFSALRRATAVVLTRMDLQSAEEPVIRARLESAALPIFHAETKLLGFRAAGSSILDKVNTDEMPPQPVFAFCGIGNPAAFFGDLKRWRVKVAGQQPYRDHHAYSKHDVKDIEARALRTGAKALLTTEKDIQNLGAAKFSQLPLYCCSVALAIRQEEQFWQMLQDKLASHTGLTV